MPPEPTVLVATVGKAPVPVALAALTLRPRELILVHSTATKQEADNIQKVVEKVRGRLGEDGALSTITSHCIGDAEDFTTTLTEYQAATRNLGGAYRLDYSGGNRVMMTCAVWQHLESSGDHHGWRSYVDEESGHLVFGDDETHSQPVNGAVLTLVDLAELHGLDLEYQYGKTCLGDSVRRNELLKRTGAHLRKLPELPWTDQAKRLNDFLPPLFNVDAGARSLAATVFPHVGALRGGIGRNVDNATGAVAEMWALLHYVTLLGATGPSDGGRGDGTTIELEASAKATRKVGDVTSDVAQFDLLLRVGHRVLAVEVKTNPVAAHKVLGNRPALARLVFGSATQSALTTVERVSPDGFTELNHAVTALKREMPWLARLELTDLGGNHPVPTLVNSWLSGTASARPPVLDPDSRPLPKANGPCVFSAAGTPLAVAAAAAVALQEDALPLGIGIPQHFDAAKDPQMQLRTLCARLLQATSRPQPAFRRLTRLSETAVAELLGRTGFTTVVVTPGQKSVAAGLVRAAHNAGKVEAVAHVGTDGRVRRLGGGEPTALAGTVSLSSLFAKDFAEKLPEEFLVDDALRGLAAAIARWDHASNGNVFFPKPPGDATGAPWRSVSPPAVVVGSTRCATLHAVRRCGAHDNDTVKKHYAQARSRILLDSARVRLLVGDAHTPVVLLPKAAGAHNLDAGVLSRMEVPNANEAQRRPWEDFAALDGWLLGLWHAGGVDFPLDKLTQHLDGELSLTQEDVTTFLHERDHDVQNNLPGDG